MSDKIQYAIDGAVIRANGEYVCELIGRDAGRLHDMMLTLAQQPAPVAVPSDLRVKAENFIARMRRGADVDRAAERELEDADEAQACAVQASIQDAAATMVEQLLAQAAPAPAAQEPCGGCGATDESQRCIGCMHQFTPPAAEQPSAVKVPRELLERIEESAAGLEGTFVDDQYGPGEWTCPACGAYCNAIWHLGKITNNAEIAHEPDCWLSELRALLGKEGE